MEITTSLESTILEFYKVAQKCKEFEAIQCKFRPIAENAIFSTQTYKLAADLDRAQNNTHFQKKIEPRKVSRRARTMPLKLQITG